MGETPNFGYAFLSTIINDGKAPTPILQFLLNLNLRLGPPTLIPMVSLLKETPIIPSKPISIDFSALDCGSVFCENIKWDENRKQPNVIILANLKIIPIKLRFNNQGRWRII